jgi:hypothetical protein
LTATRQFSRRMPVYLANDRLLGRVEEVSHGTEYVHVRQGHLFIWDWYIPAAAIARVDDRGVHLAVHRPDLLRNGWNVPAHDYLLLQGATPGYDYAHQGDTQT